MGKGQANYINKRLVSDWEYLQEWLQERRTEMQAGDISTANAGYCDALNDVMNELIRIMNNWPKI